MQRIKVKFGMKEHTIGTVLYAITPSSVKGCGCGGSY